MSCPAAPATLSAGPRFAHPDFDRRGGHRVPCPSYLLTLLDLAYHTGRRIGQIIALRDGDFLPKYRDPATGAVAPSLRWRAEHDKQRTERVARSTARRTPPSGGC